MDDNDDVVIDEVVATVVGAEEEVTEMTVEDDNEGLPTLFAELAAEFVITFSAVFTPASEVGVERFIGGVLAFGGGGCCSVSIFS